MADAVTCAASSSGVAPGLGFLHLATTAAQIGSGGARGAPKGEKAASKDECCARCGAHPSCTAWVQRGKMCYLGNCSTSLALPCLERMRTGAEPAAQPVAGASPPKLAAASAAADSGTSVLLCTRPALAKKAKPATNADATAASRSEGLALLLLGHRSRLMLTSLPANVVRPVVASGSSLTLFALLENSTMAKAFRGRRPMGNPALAGLSDADLASHLSREVIAAGGGIGEIRMHAHSGAPTLD